MAQPLAVDGAMKSADRPFGRAVSDFFTPSASASRLMRTHRATLVSSPYGSGMRQGRAGEARQDLPASRQVGRGGLVVDPAYVDHVFDGAR